MEAGVRVLFSARFSSGAVGMCFLYAKRLLWVFQGISLQRGEETKQTPSAE